VSGPVDDNAGTSAGAQAALAGISQRLSEVGGSLLATLERDVQVIKERDPAARSTLEILTCYPGLHAVWLHRAAHALWKRNVPLVPRLVSQFGRFLTGVDIHPGATLGEGLFIDHASGVVIGETAEVGENVTIYQGVTLGGTGKETGKRHPTVGNNVVIGAGAHLLGSIKIGDNVKIGSGSVVVQDAPHDTTVVGNPGRPVISEGFKVGIPDIDYTHLPDPVAEAMKCLVRRVVELENEIEELRKVATDPAAAHAWFPDARPRPDRSAPASDEACDPPRLNGTPEF
jgi:serine O-acetyltransferase